MFEFKGLGTILAVLFIGTVFGIWKVLEIIYWLFYHVKIITH